ncbi:hypothetical protein [Tardiphaga sp.]|uniref:hypothetical protein n=1 Tax=Tardiphaga sp. TaxID=1926292 RepID=UPI00262DB498|nr:hypothetical protein [Tardiphaga sp.]MDB5617874.1 hypothetical protein [Tardiphaga sp.]
MSETEKKLRKLLLKVYRKYGPRNGSTGVMNPIDFAKLSKAHVAHTWNFPDCKLMHEIARAVVGEPPPSKVSDPE